MRLLLAALGAVLMSSCSSTVSLSTDTPSPTQSQAETAAANLRVHADLLFGEHAFAVAKLAVAAAAGRRDEYHSYAGLLARNGGDLETLLRASVGETAGGQFGEAWTQQNNLLVDYIVASVTHDQKAADTASAGLTGVSVTRIAAAMEAGSTMPADQAAQLAGADAAALKLVIDDAAGVAYPKLYADAAASHAQAVAMADAMVSLVAAQFHDRFPGDPSAKATEFRAGINTLLQKQSYLMTMATEAAVASTAADLSAVSGVLVTNEQALASLVGGALGDAAGKQFGSLWSTAASTIPAYAKSGDAAARQNILGHATPDTTDAVQALLTVADDQRAKAYSNLATDDRAAATAMAAAGDAVSAAAKL